MNSLPPIRETAREIYDGFEDNDLLTYASAISFRVFFSLVPILLFGQLLALAWIFIRSSWGLVALAPPAFQAGPDEQRS